MQVKYTMRRCDTLENIALRYQIDVGQLLAANPKIWQEPVFRNCVAIQIPQPEIQVPQIPQVPQTPQAPGVNIPWDYFPQVTPPATTPPTVTPPTTTPGAPVAQIEEEVIALVNQERSRSGLPALTYNSDLANVARTKSADMAQNNYFSHNSPTYGSPFDMLQTFGIPFTAAGENIAKGQTTAQEVMNAWMNSSGHAANILNSNFSEIGVGYVYNNGVPVWTQMFIHP